MISLEVYLGHRISHTTFGTIPLGDRYRSYIFGGIPLIIGYHDIFGGIP